MPSEAELLTKRTPPSLSRLLSGRMPTFGPVSPRREYVCIVKEDAYWFLDFQGRAGRRQRAGGRVWIAEAEPAPSQGVEQEVRSGGL